MKRIKYATATPYIAAYLIFRKAGNVAFVLRQNTNWMNGYYALPAGKTEIGESFLQTAVREGQEETGVSITISDLKPVLTVHRHSNDSDWIDLVFEVTKWTGELHNAEPHIHSVLKWFNLNNLPENTVPNSRFILAQVEAGKTYAEFGWDN